MTNAWPTAWGSGRERFHELAGDLWTAFRWVRDREPIRGTDAEQITQLADDSAIRDIVSAYAYGQDIKDAPWTASLFATDGVFGHRDGSGRETEGREAIGLRFQNITEAQKVTRHRVTNYMLRFLDGGAEAWLTAYFHMARIRHSGEVESVYGRYFGRFAKSGDQWQIADWRPAVDFVQLYGDDSIEQNLQSLTDPPESLPGTRAVVQGKSPPFDGGRATWHALRDDVWNAHRWLLGQELPTPSPEEMLVQLLDEVAIRELVSNYAYAHDSRDLAWTSSCFADDAVLINETSVNEGNAAIVDIFRTWNQGMVLTFHRFSNLIVRFVPGTSDAWLSAYSQVTSAKFDLRYYTYVRYFARVTKASGQWKIADWRIARDAHPQLLPGGSTPAVPTGGGAR